MYIYNTLFSADDLYGGYFAFRAHLTNPYYININQVILPAAILNDANIYKEDRPKYMNFGAIGFWIGHEIIHGFDSKGRHYNEDGNLEEWWDDETERGYAK